MIKRIARNIIKFFQIEDDEQGIEDDEQGPFNLFPGHEIGRVEDVVHECGTYKCRSRVCATCDRILCISEFAVRPSCRLDLSCMKCSEKHWQKMKEMGIR